MTYRSILCFSHKNWHHHSLFLCVLFHGVCCVFWTLLHFFFIFVKPRVTSDLQEEIGRQNQDVWCVFRLSEHNTHSTIKTVQC